jgi:hypothetical protein
MPATPVPGPLRVRRIDAGTIKLTDRDITGLTLVADQYGAPVDLLAQALDVQPERLRGIMSRWRHAGWAHTGNLGKGPAWCWPTLAGMRLLGLPYTAKEPSATRLPHIRAVLAVRLWLQSSQAYKEGQGWWRSERRIRAAAGGRVGIAHLPDAEVHWPSLEGAPYAGQIWAIEAELTPKPLARTTGIMRGMLTRTSDYGPNGTPSIEPRYAQIVYLVAPAAVSIVSRSIGNLPEPLQARMIARDLPPGARG